MWGVLRFPRSVSNGAGARAARVSAARAVAARACDPRTPKVQHCQNCQNRRGHWHLNEKDVLYSKLFKLFEVGVPKLGNVPTQTVRLNRMHVPFDLLRLIEVLRKISHRGHTFGGHTVLLRVSCTRHSRGQGIMSDRHQNGTTRSALHYGYTRSRRPCSALIARY